MTAPKGGKRAAVVAGAVAAALIGGTGSAYALGAFDGFFQGDGVASVMPSDAVAFGQVDFDPSAAQKVGAFRLTDSVPELKAALTDSDPKKAVFEWLMSEHGGGSAAVDYAADIEPWLGDDAGFALLPANGGEPVPVVAVQVKDETAAEAGFAKLEAAARTAHDDKASDKKKGSASDDSEALEDSARIYKDGYALIVPKSAEADVRQRVEAGRLSDDAEFSGDMEALGDPGIASFWFDQTQMMKAVSDGSTPAAMENTAARAGRSAGALRFGDTNVDIATVTRGAEQPTVNALSGVGSLPADTVFAASFAGGETSINEMWPTLVSAMATDPEAKKALDEFQKETGLNLPEDLATLLGKQFDMAWGKQDFAAFAKGDLKELPKIGVRLHTDPAKAQGVLDKVYAAVEKSSGGEGMSYRVPSKATNDGLALSPHAGWLNQLVSPSGALSSSPAFQATVPEPDKQASVMFVDLDALEPAYLDSVPAEKRDAVKALSAIGATQTPLVNGESTGLVRITVN